MNLIAQSAVILASFSGAGALIDRVMSRRHKTTLHFKLLSLWDRIDDTRVGDLPGAVASVLLVKCEEIFGASLISLRFAISSIVLSWFITTTESVASGYIWGHAPYRAWHDLLPFWPWYTNDYILNSVAIILLIVSLRWLRRARAWRALTIVTLTIATGFALTVANFEAGYWTNDFVSKHTLPAADLLNMESVDYSCHVNDALLTQLAQRWGVRKETVSIDAGATALMSFADISAAYLSLFTRGEVAYHRVLVSAPLKQGRVRTVLSFQIRASRLLVNAKALFLVALLLLAVGGAMIGKLLLSLARFTSLQVLEAATDADPMRDPKSFMPGTLLGAVLGVLGSVVTALATVSAR
jgi:hypothetical protein